MDSCTICVRALQARTPEGWSLVSCASRMINCQWFTDCVSVFASVFEIATATCERQESTSFSMLTASACSQPLPHTAPGCCRSATSFELKDVIITSDLHT
jgi:hypothetical protein